MRELKRLKELGQESGINEINRIFNHPEFGELRVLVDGRGILWFEATELAVTLGYINPRDAIIRHCRYVVKHDVWVSTGLKSDGSQAIKEVQLNMIPEFDLYRLITNSELPSTIRFEKWLFEEVLPAIRQYGAYISPAKLEQVLNNIKNGY